MISYWASYIVVWAYVFVWLSFSLLYSLFMFFFSFHYIVLQSVVVVALWFRVPVSLWKALNFFSGKSLKSVVKCSPVLCNIYHTPVARYSLFVLKVPLNTNRPDLESVWICPLSRVPLDCWLTLSFSKMWLAIQQVLLLLRAKAAIERGFSVTKQTVDL